MVRNVTRRSDQGFKAESQGKNYQPGIRYGKKALGGG